MTNTCLQLQLFDEEKPDCIDWTENDVMGLREFLFHRSLSQLADHRANKETISEVIEWVYSDEMHPFSFIVCCAAIGLDYDSVRDGISFCMKQMDKPTKM